MREGHKEHHADMQVNGLESINEMDTFLDKYNTKSVLKKYKAWIEFYSFK